MAKASIAKKWSVEQRLEFIDFRLFWEGSIQRRDLVDQFDVSVPQASLDLAEYRESVPDNIQYDASRKSYVAGPKFQPRYFVPNPARYLAQLGAIQNGVISVDDTLMSSPTPSSSIPIPTRPISPQKLRALVYAIRENRSVHIEYFSLNKERSGAMWREITPHALGSDGLRWHIRALCHLSGKFKDFIISRCLSVGDFGEPKSGSGDDDQWNSFFEVVLTPNPHLSEAQRQAIELDFGMENGCCAVNVRHAMLYYFDKRLRLDIEEDRDCPQRTPIVVKNREPYGALLKQMSF